MKISDALALAPAPGCRIKPPVLRGFSGGASTAGAAQNATHGYRACVDAFIRHRANSGTADRSGRGWDARDFCHIRYGAMWREARWPPLFQATCQRHRPESTSRRGSHHRCCAIEGASRETRSRNLSLVEKSSVSQDAASAYEIARGVAFGSLLPGVVTRVT